MINFILLSGYVIFLFVTNGRYHGEETTFIGKPLPHEKND